ncbi:MAG TPA: thioesterase family protein [Micromonosporaceae bacterium]|nr:thioesterase family protein [Micromonosporaceae bacterium]
MSDAFFLPTGEPERFVATPHTEGLWERTAQHGGPPCALVARAVERLPSSIPGPAQVARLTVEILGPVPTGEVRVEARVARPGRSVELVEAELSAAGRVGMRARAWRVRTAALDLPGGPPGSAAAPPPPYRPETGSPSPSAWSDRGFLAAVEWRFVSGRFDVPGPAVAWSRLRLPVVAGEQPSPLQRLVTLADCGNGLSSRYDFGAWWFINTELTIHLHRAPVGEWFCARADSTLDPSGVGLAETELYDDAGRVGRGAQALMVGPRR